MGSLGGWFDCTCQSSRSFEIDARLELPNPHTGKPNAACWPVHAVSWRIQVLRSHGRCPMTVTKPWTAPEDKPVLPVDLSKPIPSWDSPEYPAEWPKNDPGRTVGHAYILHYLSNALLSLLRRRGRPFAVNQDIGLHFVDDRGQAQRCDPDLMVMPFPNTGKGSLRHRDMPCPPDCVIEVASRSTVDNDLGIKKEWYAWMGVREYWILDPVDSDDPAHFEHGLLLPDGPLMGWRLEQDRYEPLATFWDAAARTWSAHAPALACDILMSQALHKEETDGGYRLVAPETGGPLPSSSEKDQLLAEKDKLLAEKDVQLAEKERAIQKVVRTMAQLRYDDSTADRLRSMMQRTSTPVPAIDVVRRWMAKPSSEEFLDLARQHFGLSESSRPGFQVAVPYRFDPGCLAQSRCTAGTDGCFTRGFQTVAGACRLLGTASNECALTFPECEAAHP
ncbi:MAG: Uma2 family endonuclease [Caldilineaceae bacterium SB0665_bin_21]|nr:Uma2 family endonuclease [Caldilineaceae bacterium SB0665_bin_21]